MRNERFHILHFIFAAIVGGIIGNFAYEVFRRRFDIYNEEEGE